MKGTDLIELGFEKHRNIYLLVVNGYVFTYHIKTKKFLIDSELEIRYNSKEDISELIKMSYN